MTRDFLLLCFIVSIISKVVISEYSFTSTVKLTSGQFLLLS